MLDFIYYFIDYKADFIFLLISENYFTKLSLTLNLFERILYEKLHLYYFL